MGIFDFLKNRNRTAKDEAHFEPRRLNIVVVGRSGVGKSSFLNYAAGKKVFETGNGDPVTQSYFDVIEVERPEKNVIYSLFDTKGLEAGNTDEWKQAIYSEIERRDESDNIYDWFHTIIYCIDASSKRIQPFEVNTIKEMAKNGSVLVLLTKKDLVSPDILANLRQQILTEVGDGVQVLSVCSVSTRTRKGESKANGLEDVLRVSFLGLWEKVSKTLPYQIVKRIAYVRGKFGTEKTLPGLCAFASLTLVLGKEGDEERLFFSDGDIADAVKLDVNDGRNPSIKHFKEIEKLSGVAVSNAGREVVLDFEGCYFPELFRIPMALRYDLLDDKCYRDTIRTYYRLLKEILTGQIEQIKIGLRDIRPAIGKNGSVVKEIITFCNDVNGTIQKPLFHHKTEEAISALEQFDYDDLSLKFQKVGGSVLHALHNIDDTVFFSGEERRYANLCYSKFQGWVSEKINEFDSLVQNFINSYKAELHSYGQYCLREDELSGVADEKKEAISKMRELIRVALSDNVITPKEYRMLVSMAETMGLNEEILTRLIGEAENDG